MSKSNRAETGRQLSRLRQRAHRELKANHLDEYNQILNRLFHEQKYPARAGVVHKRAVALIQALWEWTLYQEPVDDGEEVYKFNDMAIWAARMRWNYNTTYMAFQYLEQHDLIKIDRRRRVIHLIGTL